MFALRPDTDRPGTSWPPFPRTTPYACFARTVHLVKILISSWLTFCLFFKFRIAFGLRGLIKCLTWNETVLLPFEWHINSLTYAQFSSQN